MNHQDFIRSFQAFRRKEKRVNRIFLIGFPLLVAFLAIGCLFHNFLLPRTSNTTLLAACFIILLAAVSIPALHSLTIARRWFQALVLTCPHCGRKVSDRFGLFIASAAGRCRYCGRGLLADPIHPLSPEPRIDRQELSLLAKRLPIIAVIIPVFSIGIPYLIFMVVFFLFGPSKQWMQEYQVPFAVLFFIYQGLPIAILGYGLHLKYRCPCCREHLVPGIIEIIIATGNCYYCGSKIISEGEKTGNGITFNRDQFQKDIRNKRSWIPMVFFILLFLSGAVVVTASIWPSVFLLDLLARVLPLEKINVLLFFGSKFYMLILTILFMVMVIKLWPKPWLKIQCPGCGKSLGGGMPARITFATGHCPYCGQKVLLTDE